MSYRLRCTEDDADKAQEYYDAQDRREWVEWVGKILMLCLHVQIAIEKADTARAEQEDVEEL
jgi:hypothetical protein